MTNYAKAHVVTDAVYRSSDLRGCKWVVLSFPFGEMNDVKQAQCISVKPPIQELLFRGDIE